MNKFQFLIGKVQHDFQVRVYFPWFLDLFQFLIGKVQRRSGRVL